MSNVDIPEETVKEIAQGVILKTLDEDGQRRMVEALIHGVLNASAKRYSSDPERTMLEVVLEDEILKVVRELAGIWLKENRSKVEKQVSKTMEQKFASKVASAAVDRYLDNFDKIVSRGY